MNIKAFRTKNEIWMPFIYCAFLSLISLAYILVLPNSEWYIIFLAFLPVCFFMIGTMIKKMNNEIIQLRYQIEELGKKDK